MTDRLFNRDTPERPLQIVERDEGVAARLENALDPEKKERLEDRIARLEIYERYGHLALRRRRGDPSPRRFPARIEATDFEIVPPVAREQSSIRFSRTDVVGSPRERREHAVAHPANWTAVVAASLPLTPSPVPEPLALGPEFPTIRIVESELPPDVDDRIWFSRSFDFWTFDRSLDDRAGFGFHLTIRTAEPERTLPQILTRCQRLFDRRNAASAGSSFDRILKAHRGLHDLGRPLVRADYDHALDVWQWVLRLDREATVETQIAALFHDIDRLLNEPASRTDLVGAEYIRLKEDHAEAGAWIASELLGAMGLPPDSVERICSLIALHETPAGDAAATVINEADALSFFSFNSPGFFDYFDAAHCRAKVDEMVARLGPHGRSLLPTIFLRPDVAAMVGDAGVQIRRD